jgi:hypothetical protein
LFGQYWGPKAESAGGAAARFNHECDVGPFGGLFEDYPRRMPDPVSEIASRSGADSNHDRVCPWLFQVRAYPLEGNVVRLHVKVRSSGRQLERN